MLFLLTLALEIAFNSVYRRNHRRKSDFCHLKIFSTIQAVSNLHFSWEFAMKTYSHPFNKLLLLSFYCNTMIDIARPRHIPWDETQWLAIGFLLYSSLIYYKDRLLLLKWIRKIASWKISSSDKKFAGHSTLKSTED